MPFLLVAVFASNARPAGHQSLATHDQANVGQYASICQDKNVLNVIFYTIYVITFAGE
jgi:hypothetical protein